MAGAPNSFADPFWTSLAGRTEQMLDLPSGLLVGVLTKGERSNADQVSEAGARTPFQIIPATRKAAIDKYGIDPYLSPENAAEVAGKLLKDSLDRNRGNPAMAVAEYHGGTNRDNWGPRTKAYVKRVVGISPDHPDAANAAPAPVSQAGSTFNRVSQQMGFGAPSESAIANVFKAYQGGQMSADEARQFEDDVNAGHIMLPRGAVLNAPEGALGAPAATPASDTNVLPAGVMAAYNDGRMTPDEKMQLESDVAAGIVSLPPGAQVGKTERPGIIDHIKESITGDQRRTDATEAAPDWTSMPEMNSFSMAGAKTGLGTLLANPEESVQIIRSNFPGVQSRQDDKGNTFLRSSIDGKEYAIKPGFRPSDIPRAAAGIAAFTPAGRATTILGSAAATAGTQALIEGSQTATGGNFDPAEVATAGALGGAVPAVVRAVQASKQPLTQAVNRIRGIEPLPPVPPAGGPPIPPAAPPMPATELAATARKAAEGGVGSKSATQVLAEQAMPDAKTIEAAKRLGIAEYLQPDHVTTNQAYRELAQAVKSVPGSTTRAAELSGLEAVAKRADDLVEELGGTTDMSKLDSTIKGRMQATQDELSKKADTLYAQLRAGIPARADAPAPTVLRFIETRADDLGGIENLSSMERTIYKKLRPREILDDAGEVVGTKQPTYGLLDDVRRDMTAARVKSQGPFKDADTGLIKKLEMELKVDQRAAIEPHGMLDTFKAAQSAVAVRKGLEDDLVALFGKQLDKSLIGDLSGALKVLPSGDTAKLIGLLKSIPEGMREHTVASGLSTAFNISAKNRNLSFTNFTHWYEGLSRNKQAHAALMLNLPPAARKQLSDLYRVSKGISSATKERITTGRIMAVQEELRGADTLMGNIYNVAKRSAVGLAAEAVTTPMGAPGSGLAAGIASALTKGKPNALKAADALISSPEFAEAIRRAGTPGQGGAAQRLAMSKVFRDFVQAVGNPRDLSKPEQWILRDLGTVNTEHKLPAPQPAHALH